MAISSGTVTTVLSHGLIPAASADPVSMLSNGLLLSESIPQAGGPHTVYGTWEVPLRSGTWEVPDQ